MKPEYMNLAIHLALKGEGMTHPNPLVGAVIVKNDKIIGSGWHHAFGKPHAEIDAIQNSKGQLQGSELYVTLEPCSHYGKTPPCTEAILKTGFKNVYIGTRDPNPIVSGKGIELLKKHNIHVTVGIDEEKCIRINEAYNKYITKNLPFVVLKAATSLDGKIALHNGSSKWISNNEARAAVQRLRYQSDAILCGVNTILKDDPKLNIRVSGFPSKQIPIIILDHDLKIPLSANICKLNTEIYVVTSKKASQSKIKNLIKRGLNIIYCKIHKSEFDLNDLLIELGKLQITQLLVEGGSHTYTGFIKNKLADKMILFLTPKIIGDDGLSLLGPLNATKLETVPMLKSMSFINMGSDVMIEGYL